MNTYCTRIILLGLVIYSNILFSQSESNQNLFLENLETYNVINEQIYEVLNTVDYFTQKQGFGFRNKNYYFRINFSDDKIVIIETLPYSTVTLKYWLSDTKHKTIGFFYYQDHLVLVGDRNNMSKPFFLKSGNYQPVFYNNSENIKDHIYYPGMSVSFDIQGNKLIFTDNEDDIGISADEYSFMYFIKKEDTKESIAQKCRCSVEDLFSEKELLPEEGFLIIVDYHFKDGKLLGVTRVQ